MSRNKIKLFSKYYSLLLLFLVTACSVLPQPTGRTYYSLDLKQCQPEESDLKSNETHTAPKLLVRNLTTGTLFNSYKIVFSDVQAVRGTYQYASWIETPARRITALLIREIECQKLFSQVSSEYDATSSDLQLSIELTNFIHQTDAPPGSVKIELRARLQDLRTHKILATKYFSEELAAKEYSAAGAVEAFTGGTEKILEEICVWLRQLEEHKELGNR